MKATHQLDCQRLYNLLDNRRMQLCLSWRAVCRETRVSSSTITRLSHGEPPSADLLVTLLWWARADSVHVTIPKGDG